MWPYVVVGLHKDSGHIRVVSRAMTLKDAEDIYKSVEKDYQYGQLTIIDMYWPYGLPLTEEKK